MATKKDFVIGYGLQTDKSGTGTNTLVVDSINDRVGIATGASAPATTLDVNGDLRVSGGDISSGAAVNSTLFGTNTTGTIAIGGALTTGTLTLGSTNGSGTITVGNTGTAAAQAVNIATATTGTITIGGTGAAAVQLPTGKTKIGNTTLTQGGSVNITLPTLAGTLYASGNTDVALLDGGTGSSLTGTPGSLVYVSSSTAMSQTAVGTTGQTLISTGTTAPKFVSTPFKEPVRVATSRNEAVVYGPLGSSSIYASSAIGSILAYNTSTSTSTVLNAPRTSFTYAANLTNGSDTFDMVSGRLPYELHFRSSEYIVVTGTGINTANTTITSGGTAGSTLVTVASATNIVAGQYVRGNGIAADTFVGAVAGNNVTLNKACTGTVSGNITFDTIVTNRFVSGDYADNPPPTNINAIISLSTPATTTATSTLTFTQIATALQIDGVTLAANDRVLLTCQSVTQNVEADNSPQNGIYTVTTAGASWVLTRVDDLNTTAEFQSAHSVYVLEGTANKGEIFVTPGFLDSTKVLGTNKIRYGYSEFSKTIYDNAIGFFDKWLASKGVMYSGVGNTIALQSSPSFYGAQAFVGFNVYGTAGSSYGSPQNFNVYSNYYDLLLTTQSNSISTSTTASGSSGVASINVGDGTNIQPGMDVTQITGSGIAAGAKVASTYVLGSTTVPLTVANTATVTGDVEIGGTTVNYFGIKNNLSGYGPILEALGSDTNIDLNLRTKGTGVVKAGTLSLGNAAITAAGALTISSSVAASAIRLGGANDSGTVSIGNTGTAAAQAVNIATATTGTITIGGTGATAVQLPTGKTKIGQSLFAQGSAFTYTLPTVAANSTLATTGNLSQFASTTSAQLAGIISGKTGTGDLVFATTPTLVTPVLGNATSTTLTVGGVALASSYNSWSQTGSGAMGIIGHNARSGASNNTVIANNSNWHGHFIRMYYSDGIAIHTTTGTVTAGDVLYDLATPANQVASAGERVRITPAGNVGIGINPTKKLHISSGDPEIILIERTTNNNSLIQYKNTGGSMYAGLANSAAGWGIDNNNTIDIASLFFIDTSGNTNIAGNLTATGGISGNQISVNSTTISSEINARLSVGGSTSFSSFLTGLALATTSATQTYTGAATTINVPVGSVYVSAPSIASSTNALTITNSASLYIDGPPVAGLNTTLTNKYSLYVGTGPSYLQGDLTVTGVLNVLNAIDLSDNDILRLGTGDDWELFHNGTDNYMDLNVGNLLITDGTTTRFTFERTTGNLSVSGTLTPARLNCDKIVHSGVIITGGGTNAVTVNAANGQIGVFTAGANDATACTVNITNPTQGTVLKLYVRNGNTTGTKAITFQVGGLTIPAGQFSNTSPYINGGPWPANHDALVEIVFIGGAANDFAYTTIY